MFMFSLLFWIIVIIGFMIWHNECAIRREKIKEMESWSIKKLHAYAGVKEHHPELKNAAYAIAKRKEYEKVK